MFQISFFFIREEYKGTVFQAMRARAIEYPMVQGYNHSRRQGKYRYRCNLDTVQITDILSYKKLFLKTTKKSPKKLRKISTKATKTSFLISSDAEELATSFLKDVSKTDELWQRTNCKENYKPNSERSWRHLGGSSSKMYVREEIKTPLPPIYTKETTE